jgi:hypothetical protein
MGGSWCRNDLVNRHAVFPEEYTWAMAGVGAASGTDTVGSAPSFNVQVRGHSSHEVLVQLMRETGKTV